jgi:hypothetical protein
MSPNEEQAQLLEQFQRARRRGAAISPSSTPSTTISATLEAQERMLRALPAAAVSASYQPNSHSLYSARPAMTIDPLQQQLNRLREIKEEKD